MLLLPPSLTHGQARAAVRLFRESLATIRSNTEVLVVDGSALQHFDSSALSVLLECQRLAQAKGLAFTVQDLPEKLITLAQVYGVSELIQGTHV